MKEKKIVIALSLLIMVGFLYAHPAHAGWTGDLVGIAWEGAKGFIGSILYVMLVTPLSWILTFAGKFANYALQPGNMPITTSTFVQAGWGAMRDLTNMLFILVLLGIALDYILFNSVGVKRALPRLLLVALLINFSLPIAGVVLDFANVFTVFFIGQAGGAAFTENISTRLGLAFVFNATGPVTATTAAQAMNGVLSDTVFTIFFLLGTIFVFLALAAMFFLRYFYISILLIVLPLALVASAIPPLSSHFGKWNRKFIQWVMFAPAASFFLYLATVFLGSQEMAALNKAISGNSQGDSWLATTGAQIATYIFTWLLLSMSLTTANSMGITGAGVAVTMWGKGTKWMRGKAGHYTKRGADRIGATKVLEKGAELAASKGGVFGGFAARQLTTGAERLRSAKLEAATLSQQEKDLVERGSEKDVTSLIQSYASGTSTQKAKAAKMITLAEQKNKLKIKYTEDTVDENGVSHKAGDINHGATRDLKRDLRKKAKAVGDITAVKAIDASDFVIAKEAIEEKYAGYEKEGRSTDPDTGKSLVESKKRKLTDLYRKINFGKEDWDDSVVEDDDNFIADMIEHGVMSGEKLKQAQKSGNTAIIEQLRKYMRDPKQKAHRGHLLKEENVALLNWLKDSQARTVVGDFREEIENIQSRKESAKAIRELRAEAKTKEEKDMVREMTKK